MRHRWLASVGYLGGGQKSIALGVQNRPGHSRTEARNQSSLTHQGDVMAGAGRKPKPSHLKLVTGNPGRRPLIKNEAKVKAALPSPPPMLDDVGKEEWSRVSNELYLCGLLTSIDRATLAAYCQLYSRWQTAELALAEEAAADPRYRGLLVTAANGTLMHNPLVAVANKAAQDMVKFAAEFGMTPSARSRISATPPGNQQEDPTEKYFS